MKPLSVGSTNALARVRRALPGSVPGHTVIITRPSGKKISYQNLGEKNIQGRSKQTVAHVVEQAGANKYIAQVDIVTTGNKVSNMRQRVLVYEPGAAIDKPSSIIDSAGVRPFDSNDIEAKSFVDKLVSVNKSNTSAMSGHNGFWFV